jgi:hypothetical protein
MVPAKENSTRVPTWPEFVNYLLKTSIARYAFYIQNWKIVLLLDLFFADRFDEHWMPISRLCTPCAVSFDYVVKLERFEHEIQFPLKRAGIDAPNIGWSHRTGTANTRIINRYFNNLTMSEVKKLYAKYKADFQLFGYTPYKYFRLVDK